MDRLWNSVKNHIPAQHAHAVFLAAWTALWSLGALAVGMLFCGATAGSSLVESLETIFCIAAYAGIIFGLFGGMFFLMRQQD